MPPGTDLAVEIEGELRPMCCAGCRAVAKLIRSTGLGRYYDFRDALPERPESEPKPGRFVAWDRDAVLEHHAPVENRNDDRDRNRDRRTLMLVLENVHCAACAWLVQRYLGGFAGVSECRLDVSDGRLKLVFDVSQTPLSTLAAALERLGYPPHLDTPDSALARDRNERRRMLKYLIVAALGMMQVMSYALAKYIGAGEMDPETEHFFRIVSMLVAVPVALYAGQPFYRSAAAHLARRHLGLDVPVALAILLALFSSVLITLFGRGEVYFDSVVMFVFFLLLGRFAVLLARQDSGAVHSALSRALPAQACRLLSPAGSEMVGLIELAAGDRVLVADGEVVPADGVVLEGAGHVDESLLSGESEQHLRKPGDAVLAGSLVVGGSLTLRVESLGRDTVISGIVDLLGEARRKRPRLAKLADRAAAVFIAAILVATTLAGLWWWQTDPARVIPIVLAMLVVACPCALALGTPTALASASRALARAGLLTSNPDALEALPRITHVIIDKTGTLTEPRMQIADIRPGAELEAGRVVALAAALERSSRHPIARAFEGLDRGLQVEQGGSQAGQGVYGRIAGQEWFLGRPDWVGEKTGQKLTPSDDGIWLALGRPGFQPAWIRVDAGLRQSAAELVAELMDSGIEVVLASGDRPANVEPIARSLGIRCYHAGLRPADKLALAERLRNQGARVAMIGDGINDAPVLAGADISIALAEGAAIARTQADLVATGRGLEPLRTLLAQAPRVSRVIRQNLAWALCYNLGALPLAAAGLVPPWAAAIGMSASSLAVVLNARRLGRIHRHYGSAAPSPGASAVRSPA